MKVCVVELHAYENVLPSSNPDAAARQKRHGSGRERNRTWDRGREEGPCVFTAESKPPPSISRS